MAPISSTGLTLSGLCGAGGQAGPARRGRWRSLRHTQHPDRGELNPILLAALRLQEGPGDFVGWEDGGSGAQLCAHVGDGGRSGTDSS